MLSVARIRFVFCGGVPPRCRRPKLGGAVFLLQAVHQSSACFRADRTRGHMLERTAGVVCQLASPDEELGPKGVFVP